MYAPTLDRPTLTWTGTDADTDLLLLDEFDTWSIGDLAAFPCAGPTCSYTTPDPTIGAPANA